MRKNFIVDANVSGVNRIYTVKNVSDAHLSRIATKVAVSLFGCEDCDVRIKSSITV